MNGDSRSNNCLAQEESKINTNVLHSINIWLQCNLDGFPKMDPNSLGLLGPVAHKNLKLRKLLYNYVSRSNDNDDQSTYRLLLFKRYFRSPKVVIIKCLVRCALRTQ